MNTSDDLAVAYPKGTIVQSRVIRVEPFGIFVRLDQDRDVPGFIRRQDWSWARRTVDLGHGVSRGDLVPAKVLGHDGARLLLSRRQAIPDPYTAFRKRHAVGDPVAGRVELIAQKDAGVLLELEDGVEGFIPRSEIPDIARHADGFGLLAQDWVAARILRFDQGTVILSIREHLRRREEEYAHRRSQSWQALRYHPTLGLDLENLYWNLQLHEIAEPEISSEVRQRIHRILVVEDSASVSESLEMVLTHFGFTCDLASTIDEARQRLATSTYDLLILDVNLPSASGAELVSELRERDHPSYIFVLTAAAAEDWTRLVEGAERRTLVFQKPTSIDRLLDQLNHQVAQAPPDDDRRHSPGLDPSGSDDQAPISWSDRTSGNGRREMIAELLEQLRGEHAADRVFLMAFRPGPIFELIAGSFPELTREAQQRLELSPIGDTIRERRFISLPDITPRRDWFRHLVEVLPVMSFAGIALDYADQAAYGLFLLGSRVDQLRHVDERKLRAVAQRLGQYLAEGRFNEVLAENQSLLLTGFLADSLLHEIKNELQALDDFSAVQLLLSKRHADDLGAMPQEEVVELTRATVGVRQVSQRMNELIVLFRNLAGRSPAERVDLNQVIHRLRQTLQPFADENNATIDLELASDLPELVVHPKFLDQPILNLMINGIEQMGLYGSSPRRLMVRTEHRPQAELPVLVAVSDTGRGIHSVDQERIFDLFFTLKRQGTGLGLYISRYFVERFGGRLSLAQSMMFSGSELWIEIPRQVLA